MRGWAWAMAIGAAACGPNLEADNLRADPGVLLSAAWLATGATPEIRLTVLDAPCRIRVATHGWLTLNDAAGTGGVAGALTEIAWRNTEADGLRLGMVPATGAIEADLRVSCRDVTSAEDAQAVVERMQAHLDRLHPHLRAALTNAAL